jgi:hypothetical protein
VDPIEYIISIKIDWNVATWCIPLNQTGDEVFEGGIIAIQRPFLHRVHGRESERAIDDVQEVHSAV